MLLNFKRLLLVCTAALLMQSAHAFSLLGPFDTWQTSALGYDPQADQGDLGGPKNLGEEWRWNIPEIRYAFDESFINFFGTNGMNAVESAVALYNREMVNLGAMTDAQLRAKPMHTRRLHQTAQALGLLDLKSSTMGLLAEQLGLAGSKRWTWTLRGRATPAANITNYSVIQRNYDPFNYKPSSYVNGIRYTYQIRQFPAAFFAADFEDAVEIPVDQAGDLPSAVSSLVGEDVTGYGLRIGEYFSALTQDDIAGLKYIYQRHNVNLEDVTPNTLLRSLETNAITFLQGVDAYTYFSNAVFLNANALTNLYTNLVVLSSTSFVSNVVSTNVIITNIAVNGLQTNTSLGILLTNQDLYTFSEATRTNDPTSLLSIPAYAGLIITKTNTSFIQEWTPIVYLTNSPYSKVGDPPIVATNWVLSTLVNYQYEFANVITNYAAAVTDLEIQDIGRGTWSSPNDFVLFTNRTRVRTNKTSGGFYILNRATNASLVGYSLTDSAGTPNFRTTNVVTGTNTVFLFTNVINGFAAIKRVDVVNYFTNVVYGAWPIFINGVGGPTLVTNLSTNLVVAYQHNIDTNGIVYIPAANGNRDLITQTTTFLPPGLPSTLRTTNTSPFPTGTLLIYNTNDFVLEGTRIESFGFVTNNVFAFTNALDGSFIVRDLIFQTNTLQFAAFPVLYQAPPAPLERGGVDTLQFRPQRFTDFLNQAAAVSTNFYTVTTVVNNTNRTEVYRRIAGPDILFAAGDLGITTRPTPVGIRRSVNFIDNGAVLAGPLDGGPGVIGSAVTAAGATGPGTTLFYSKLSPNHFNQNPNFIDEETAFVRFAWGSFDSRTITPTVYPEDITSQIRNLQMLEALALRRNPPVP